MIKVPFNPKRKGEMDDLNLFSLYEIYPDYYKKRNKN